MSKKYSRVIGIDVSQETLEISDSKSKLTSQVVCEATGGLEIDLVDLLQENNVDVVIANPAQVIDLINQEKNRSKQCRDKDALDSVCQGHSIGGVPVGGVGGERPIL